MIRNHKVWAFSLLRMSLGINFCGHGFVRIYHGIGGFATQTAEHLASSPLPHGFVHAFGYCIPVVEALIGTLLLIGFFTQRALIAGALFMMILTIGVTANQEWATAGTQLLYSLVFFVLLFYAEFDLISIDQLRLRK